MSRDSTGRCSGLQGLVKCLDSGHRSMGQPDLIKVGATVAGPPHQGQEDVHETGTHTGRNSEGRGWGSPCRRRTAEQERVGRGGTASGWREQHVCTQSGLHGALRRGRFSSKGRDPRSLTSLAWVRLHHECSLSGPGPLPCLAWASSCSSYLSFQDTLMDTEQRIISSCKTFLWNKLVNVNKIKELNDIINTYIYLQS